MLASLRDEDGTTTVDGLDDDRSWDGRRYPEDAVPHGRQGAGRRRAARLRHGRRPLWARPAVTVLGIDCPPVVGATPAVQRGARRGSACGCRRAWTPAGGQDA